MQHDPRCPGGLLGARNETRQGVLLRPQQRHPHPSKQLQAHSHHRRREGVEGKGESKDRRWEEGGQLQAESPEKRHRGRQEDRQAVVNPVEQGFGVDLYRGEFSRRPALGEANESCGLEGEPEIPYPRSKREEEKHALEARTSPSSGSPVAKASAEEASTAGEDADQKHFVQQVQGPLRRLDRRGEETTTEEEEKEAQRRIIVPPTSCLRRPLDFALDFSATGPATDPGELGGASRNREADATAVQAPIPSGSWPNGPGRVHAGLTPSGRDAPAGESGDQQQQEHHHQHKQQLQHQQQTKERGSASTSKSSFYSWAQSRNKSRTRSWSLVAICYPEDSNRASTSSGSIVSSREESGVIGIRRKDECRVLTIRALSIVGVYTRFRLRHRRRGSHSSPGITWNRRRHLQTRHHIGERRKTGDPSPRGVNIESEEAAAVRRSEEAGQEEYEEEPREGSALRGSDAGLPAARSTRTRVLAEAASSVALNTSRTFTLSKVHRLGAAARPTRRYNRPVPESLAESRGNPWSHLPRGGKIEKSAEARRTRGERRPATLLARERRPGPGDASDDQQVKPMRHEEEAFTAGSPSTKRPLQKTKTLKAGANPSRSCCWKLPRCPLRNRPYCQHRVHQRRLLSHEQRLTSSTTSATKNQPGERCCLLPSEPRTEAPTPFQLAGSEPDQDSSRSYNDLERIADPKASDECSHDEKINRLSTNIATRPGQRDLPDANDLQSSAGLVRNTAFRVDPREYHHPAPVPGPQTMENRFSLEVPPEKLVHRDTTDTSTSKSSSRAKHRGTDDVHQVLGLRSTSLDSPGFPSLEDAHSRIPGSGCRERTPEYDRENVLENTAFNDLDEDGDDPRIVETNACLDVPGGRLFGIVCLGRGLASGCAVSGSPKRSFVSTGNPEYPSVNELSVDSRTCGSSDDREKWKKPRRRRCRRCSETRRRKLQESWRDEELDEDETDEDEDTDGRLLGEVLEGDGASSVNTARSGGPSLSTKRTSRRKSKKRRRGRGARAREGKWSSPWREKRKPEASRKRFAGWHAEGILRQADTGRFFKSDKTFSRKRGVRSYGLSLVLYLLALPILCSSDSSAPVASAFAQKSPLTHGDNFTARNSSSQHQANHEMRREGLIDDDMPHPYNEYSWEINQINPWLSACDLAGPAPADLQGSCGPPEVPKSCPERCSSRNQADLNKAFAEVIEAFGINERARSGAGGSRWRPAGTTTTNKSAGNKIKDDDRKNKRTEETADAAAPVQCLFYLEASHKRDICRDNFGRGSSLSFSNTRENRYWYLSALRLRHCCERPVVNALAPGKGGPLEDVLNGGPKCSDALDKILVVDSLAARLHCEFEEVLARYDCGQSYSVIHNCTHCKEAYRKWVCSSLVPYFAHGGPPALETSTNTWLGSRLRPCRSFCQSVEQRCPYLLPGDRAPAYPTQYAGEPTFLCRDPNIPETGEQAMRALHGNERDECCFHACSEDEPGLGVCANCTDLKAPSNRAGHDIPTAPQCEITSTSSIQSGSTGEKSTDSRIGSASSVESSSASPSTSTTTSASFCGGGGVGSMPSSSGQSTTQTPPPSSISLICMFWIWAALISLCTGQTVFPWSPPSSLSMGDYSTRRGAGARSRKRRKRLEKREIFGRRKSEEEERRTKHVGTGKKMDIGKMAALSITSSAGSASRSFLRSSTRLLVSRRRMRRDLSVILILKFTRVFLVALTTIIMKNNYYRNYYIDLFNIVRQYSLVMLFMLVRYYEKCHFRLSRINYVLIIINESSSFRKRPHQIGHLAPRCRTPAAAVAAAAIASSFSLLCRRHDYDYDYHYYCYYYYYYYCCYYEAKFHRVFSPSQGQRLDLERFERKLDDYAAPRPPRGKRRKRRPRIWRRRRRRRRIYVVRFFFSNLHYCFFSYAHSQRPSFVATRTSGLPDHTKSTSPTTTQFYYCDHYHYFFHYYYLCCYFCYYFHSHYQYPSSCHYYYNGAITWWWWWWCWWWWSSSPSWSSFCIFLYPSRASSRAHRDRPP